MKNKKLALTVALCAILCGCSSAPNSSESHVPILMVRFDNRSPGVSIDDVGLDAEFYREKYSLLKKCFSMAEQGQPADGVELLKKRLGNDADALILASYLRIFNRLPFAKNVVDELNALKSSDLRAKYLLGVCYSTGYGVPVNHKAAAEAFYEARFIDAAKVGYAASVWNGGLDSEAKIAYSLLLELINSDAPAAWGWYGYYQGIGFGCVKNPERSLQWVNMAAQKEDLRSIGLMADKLAYNGNYIEAIKMFESISSKYPQALSALGGIYRGKLKSKDVWVKYTLLGGARFMPMELENLGIIYIRANRLEEGCVLLGLSDKMGRAQAGALMKKIVNEKNLDGAGVAASVEALVENGTFAGTKWDFSWIRAGNTSMEPFFD